MRWLSSLLAALILAGCGESTVAPVLHDTDPTQLSDWQVVLREGNRLLLADRVEPYALNSVLFTDYAHKLRTISVPAGVVATAGGDGHLNWPVGTIISKTFFYPRKGARLVQSPDRGQHVAADGSLDLDEVRLMETRLLVHRADGWAALPYVWNEAQTEATLAIAGDLEELSIHGDDGEAEFAYVVPNMNQCGGCHETDTSLARVLPIGPTQQNLDRIGVSGTPQLGKLVAAGMIELDESRPALADWRDDTQALEARARAYLDVNCAHCHNPKGHGDTSGLFLDLATSDPASLGICKLPIAAGQGTGGHPYSIVPGDPDASILTFRMASLDPGAMMPELGRSLLHEEGLALIEAWIRSLPGACETVSLSRVQ